MKTIKRLGRLLLIAAFGLSALTVSQITTAASNIDGRIVGTVTADGQGVAGATVTATNPSTGFSRTVTTDGEGEYRFSSLSVGEYTVSVSSSAGSASREDVRVNVGTATTVNLVVGDAAELGEVTVQGATISPIDITSTESATILGEQTIDRIPVNRSVTDIALLAPGTTRGDSAFGNLASFGGATVGENVCYIDGLNVTNFRNGLGCSTVPFEFYQEFQLKTGGYSAEYGRATGGVINAVTKSGTNDYKYGVNLFWEPWIDGINVGGENTYFRDTGNLYVDNRHDERTEIEANVYASGPIVKDKAFFYVLYNFRDIQRDSYDDPSGSYFETGTDDAFWGAKLDFNISSNHTVQLLAFSDESDTTTEVYDYAGYNHLTDDTGAISRRTTTLLDGSTVPVDSTSQRGGMNYVVRYTGYFTPDFTLNVMVGENEYDLTDTSGILDQECPLIIDVRTSSTNTQPGCWSSSLPTEAVDTREAMRIDGEWFVGDHQIKFGFDNETNTSTQTGEYSGGYYWRYLTSGGTDLARLRYYGIDGEFETETSAIYIEDTWSVTDTVTLRLGLRNEAFKNKNEVGDAFIDISSQLAPRLGVAWDALGDGTLKVFANYGRYYLPVASNTNVRLAGNETFTEAYFFYDTVDPATGLPITFIDGDGDVINFDPANVIGPGADPNTNYVGADPIPGNYNIYADGGVPDTAAIVDADIDPMYQDEIIVGFLRDLGDNWSFGVRGIFRDLKSTLEDITTDAAFQSLKDDGIIDPGASCGTFDFHYILTNPGSPATITWDGCGDIDGDGVDDGNVTYNFTAEQLGFPESERYYNAVELLLERAWDGEWFLQGSYTWSQSYGNNEGFVRSDNGQDDAGLTTLYDFPGLLTGAYGPLPNDRTHSLKLFGAYQFAPSWTAGFNLLMESGRPVNAFGVNTDEFEASLYGAESFYQGGNVVPRGTRGRTPFRTSLDLNVEYRTTFGDTEAAFGVDVFNIFNSNVPTEVNERAENDAGGVERRYLLPTSYQRPRYLRLRAQFDF